MQLKQMVSKVLKHIKLRECGGDVGVGKRGWVAVIDLCPEAWAPLKSRATNHNSLREAHEAPSCQGSREKSIQCSVIPTHNAKVSQL